MLKWVRLFWNGGFGMSHSGKGSSHLTRLRWRPLTGTTLPCVARGVVALVLALLVEAPVLIEVSAGAESAKPSRLRRQRGTNALR